MASASVAGIVRAGLASRPPEVMNRAVRHYIFRILLIHLGLLALVVAVVGFAGAALYSTAEREAETVGLERLALPANQVDNAIERHIRYIFDTLDETSQPAQGPLADDSSGATGDQADAQRLWSRLQGRISDLLILDARTLQITHRFANPVANGTTPAGQPMQPPPGQANSPAPAPELAGTLGDDGSARQLVQQAQEMLREAAELGRPRLSSMYMVRESKRPIVLAVAPVGPAGEPPATILVAAIPVLYLEQNFMLPAVQSQSQGMLLFDAEARLVAGGDPGQTGLHARELVPKAIPSDFADFILQTIGGSSVPQQVFEGRMDLGTIDFMSVLGLMRPIRPIALLEDAEEEPDPTPAQERDDPPPAGPEVRRGSERQNLWLVAVLNRESVVGPLEQVTRTVTIWAGALVVAFTGILVSSAVQLIRGRNRLERLQTEMVEKEMREARQIQLMWLPDDEVHETATRHIEIAAKNIPASHVSGDFYNYFDLTDGRCAVVIGDVTGHGMSAAFLMATTQLLVKMTLQRVDDPGKALTEVNHLLCTQAFSGQFVTIQIVVFSRDTDQILISSAGHPPPLVCRPDGSWEPLRLESDVVLGVLEEAQYTSERIKLDDARSLLFYTDGVVEAKNLDEERFNTEMLCQRLAGRVGCNVESASSLANETLAIVREFTGGAPLEDDVTILAVHTAPTRRRDEGGGMRDEAEGAHREAPAPSGARR